MCNMIDLAPVGWNFTLNLTVNSYFCANLLEISVIKQSLKYVYPHILTM